MTANRDHGFDPTQPDRVRRSVGYLGVKEVEHLARPEMSMSTMTLKPAVAVPMWNATDPAPFDPVTPYSIVSFVE